MINVNFSMKTFMKNHKETLTKHLEMRLTNNLWLYPILKGENISEYIKKKYEKKLWSCSVDYKKNKAKKIENYIKKIKHLFPYTPEVGNPDVVEFKEEIFKSYNFVNQKKNKTLFLLNIPSGYLPSYEIRNYDSIINLLKILRNESFEKNEELSIEIAKKRLFVVMESLKNLKIEKD
jgi:hypothetical protein